MCNHPFRDHTPIRRSNPSPETNYKRYKNSLQEDFQSRCWYCNDKAFRFDCFHIDHFIPQKPPKNIINRENWVANNTYSNLVFSCPYCNRSKGNIWPTWIIERPHNNRIGFIDPTLEEYGTLFLRDNSGNIILNQNYQYRELAQYIYNTLHLSLPIHSHKRKIDSIQKNITQISSLPIQNNQIKNKIRDLKAKCYDLFNEYFF